MRHGIGIKTAGGMAGGNLKTTDVAGALSGTRSVQLATPVSRSGTWRITWRGDAEPDNVYARTFHYLFERQLNTFAAPRVFLLGNVQDHDLADIQARCASVAVGDAETSGDAKFDVVWDAGMLSRAPLSERSQLVQRLDARLEIGGTCVVIAHDERASDDTSSHAISPEEIAAYFFPAYVVAHHEEHEFALPPGRPVAFHTLALVKQAALTSDRLDPELHRSLHAVAARRRAITR
jgi:hypothetical protein